MIGRNPFLKQELPCPRRPRCVAAVPRELRRRFGSHYTTPAAYIMSYCCCQQLLAGHGFRFPAGTCPSPDAVHTVSSFNTNTGVHRYSLKPCTTCLHATTRMNINHTESLHVRENDNLYSAINHGNFLHSLVLCIGQVCVWTAERIA